MKNFFYVSAGLFFLLCSLLIIFGLAVTGATVASNWGAISQLMGW